MRPSRQFRENRVLNALDVCRLRSLKQKVWGDKVTVISSDMRLWNAPEQVSLSTSMLDESNLTRSPLARAGAQHTGGHPRERAAGLVWRQRALARVPGRRAEVPQRHGIAFHSLLSASVLAACCLPGFIENRGRDQHSMQLDLVHRACLDDEAVGGAQELGRRPQGLHPRVCCAEFGLGLRAIATGVRDELRGEDARVLRAGAAADVLPLPAPELARLPARRQRLHAARRRLAAADRQNRCRVRQRGRVRTGRLCAAARRG